MKHATIAYPGGTASAVRQLWKRRFDQYRKEASGYWAYVARSQFFGFLFLLFIVSSYYYAKTLDQLPTTFPYLWIVLVLLTPALSAGSVRTLLKNADRVFLLPLEPVMSAFFRPSFRYSLIIQSLRGIVLTLVIWPLYKHCTGENAQPLLLMLLFILLIKTANLLGSWQEGRFSSPGWRLLSQGYRWLLTGVALYVLFGKGPFMGGIVLLAALLLWTLIYKLLPARQVHGVAWDFLIDNEKRQQHRLYLFFSGFADVPQLPVRVKQRRVLAGITRLYRFKRSSLYLYLFTKTFVRSELLGIVVRITLIAALVIIAVQSVVAAALVSAAAMFITLMQLTSLEQSHRYTFWLQTYPVNERMKIGAVLRIVAAAFTVQGVILSLLMLLSGAGVYSAAPLAALALGLLLCATVMKRKFTASFETE
ncbi:ABC transporter permease [Paenibacillus sp. FJAT-26967]|uniref:ABC transporter permease n=1 Tax=Paenibacillus sp. FJAT-26967 TaxID=1729690 RepID=UPI00083964E4|nr:ABC transporter permease [Paenibacillus sp. FJAT-26967]